MSNFRPTTHPERDQVIAAVATYTQTATADPMVLEIIQRLFQTPRDDYTAIRQEHGRLMARLLELSTRADHLDEEFDSIYRRWLRTVTLPDGKVATAELTRLQDGVLPSDLVQAPQREEVTRCTRLFEKLPPELQGDPARLTELKEVVARFEPVVTAREQAERDKLAAGARLAAATLVFDRSYAKLVKSLKGLLGDQLRAILPIFPG